MRLLLALAFSTVSIAHAAVSESDSKCAVSKKDSYETATRIGSESKKFAGQCIDTDRFRPAVIIENTAKALTFANYKHGGEYWTATLSKKAKVDAIVFHIVRFDVVSGVTAAHTQFRVRLEKGSELELVSQLDKSKKATTNDIVISYEASRPKDVPYNFALGAFSNYVSVARALSGEQRQAESVENTTEQYLLNVPSDVALNTLVSAIEQSDKEKFSRIYNTLKPNCTTEVFDLFDKMPAVAAKNPEPFLTVLSNDPVAGPSIEALSQRGLLKQRVANLKEELETGANEAPADKVPKAKNPLLVTVEGAPYALVFVVDADQNEKAMLEAQKLAYGLFPQVAQQVVSSLMLNEGDSENLVTSLSALGPQIKKQLKALDKNLPQEASFVTMYLAPWNGQGTKLDVMKQLDVPVRLPFETYQVDYKEIYGVTSGLNQAAALQKKSPAPFGVLGFAVHMYLAKGNSKVTIQGMGQLGPQEKPMAVSNDQVDIHMLEIPSPADASLAPVAIVNFSQAVSEDVPEIKVNFGPFGGIAGSINPERQGQLQVLTGMDCTTQAAAAPRMLGKLTLLGISKWKDVVFQIFSLDLDAKTASVKTMDIRIKTFPVSCTSKDDVNEQFTENANTKIEELKDKMTENQESTALSILNKILSNNEAKTLPGMR